VVGYTFGETIVVYTSTSDGETWQSATNYTLVWITSGGVVTDGANDFYIGQKETGGYYYIFRAFVFFDTSSIPDDTNITSVVLSLYGKINGSDTDFNITIQHGGVIYPHDPLEAGDYNKDHYSGNGGNTSTSGFSTSGYNNITLTSTGIGWISKTSTTKLAIRSNLDINGTTPTGDEYVQVYSREAGESKAPKLYVTYDVQGYNYLVHGPYYENGNVANVNVSLRLEIENLPAENYTLDGAGGADTLNITVAQRGVAFTWNITSPSYNMTRAYYLTTATFEEIWIYLPHPDDPCYLYTFTVTDFIGVTNGFLETIKNVGGQNRIVERQSIGVISSLPFWMVWANRYDIRLVCDQGTYSWGGFIAGGETSQNLIVTAGMFPEIYPGLNVTVTAQRMNATYIQVTYNDNDLLTSWVNVTILYMENFTWTTAYSVNNTGNTHTIDWYSADEDVDYVVKVTAYYDGAEKTWTFSCPKPPSEDENPWSVLDALGTWPFPAKYTVGLVLVLMVFGVFSYASMPLGCILGTITTAFLNLINWLNISWSLLALAFAVGIFAAIAKAKKEEREI